MSILDAKQIVGTQQGPTKDGEAVGRHIVQRSLPLRELTIDMSGLGPEDLVSSFVNAVLHEIEEASLSLEDAPRIRWGTKYPAEAERMGFIVSLYVEDWRQRKSPPVPPAAPRNPDQAR